MTKQFLRAASLVVGNASGQGLDLSTLRLDFSVMHASVQTPKIMIMRVTNVSKKTAATIKGEFTQVSFSAGYVGALGLLFKGEVRQFRFGRENPTDTYLDIIAADGDKAYSTGFISQTVDKGWTAPDISHQIALAASVQGLSAGTPPPATGQAGIRPKVMFGPIRDHARILAVSTGTSWSINDGQLNFAVLNAAANQTAAATTSTASTTGSSTQAASATTQAIVLSPSTGLIGIPKQTIDGVEATCLLNPQIKAGSYVKIDSDLITATQTDNAYAATQGGNLGGTGSNMSVAGLSPSGTYRVVYVDHYGDTRGDPWYSVMSCFADDGQAVQGQSGIIAVP